jgi:hypothetical protein
MNPQLALALARQRHAALRGENSPRLARVGVARWSPAMAGQTVGRARAASGWFLVEVGLKLALSSKDARQPNLRPRELPRSQQVTRAS